VLGSICLPVCVVFSPNLFTPPGWAVGQWPRCFFHRRTVCEKSSAQIFHRMGYECRMGYEKIAIFIKYLRNDTR